MSSYGYVRLHIKAKKNEEISSFCCFVQQILPIEDHVLTVKNDGTFYRFQTPYFWPSNHGEPDNIDYGKCPFVFIRLYFNSNCFSSYRQTIEFNIEVDIF